MAIERFTPSNLRDLRADLDKALGVVAAKYGITLESGKMSYSPETVKVAVEGAVEGGLSFEIKTMASIIGVDPTVAVNGMRIVGYRSRSAKAPWVIKHTDGKRYIHTDASVKAMWGVREHTPA